MLQGIDADKSNQIRIRSMLEIVQEVPTCKQVFIWIKFNTSHANSLNSQSRHLRPEKISVNKVSMRLQAFILILQKTHAL